jgi:hypothetical protein
MRKLMAMTAMAALLLAGCAKQAAPELPADPVEQAAACGVVTAASEREAAGAKGDLSADAQARILHFAMLYAAEGKSFDQEKVNTVSKRMPALFDSTIKGTWQTLRPACAAAFPATQVKQPVLPAKSLDSQLECYALADFLRKALGSQGPSYAEATMRYGILTGKLDMSMTPALRAAGIRNGNPLNARRAVALADATRLGQPGAVIAACEKKYG